MDYNTWCGRRDGEARIEVFPLFRLGFLVLSPDVAPELALQIGGGSEDAADDLDEVGQEVHELGRGMVRPRSGQAMMVTRGDPGPPRVLALLGAGRGGTTLLYKLLALHPQAAFLSNYEARFPRWRFSAVPQRWLRPRIDLKLRTWFQVGGGAYFDRPRPRLHALVPAPVEAEPLYAACGVPLEPKVGQPVNGSACARLRQAFANVQNSSAAQLVLTKRTSNNRRVDWLESAFDEPRYVHLVRDGRAVALSLTRVNWWPDHRLFWVDSTPSELATQGRPPLAIAAENWSREIMGVEQALQQVDSQRVLTVRYEELLARPQVELTRVLDFAGLSANLDAYWSAIGRLGLKPAPDGAAKGWSADERQLVETIAGDALRRFGYAN